jgi:hypothetical protein
MTRATLERTDSLRFHPNLTATAEMLGVSASTISRRSDLQVELRGERDRVLAPAEVLRLAGVYRRRSLNEVALDLLEHARTLDPSQLSDVEAEIEQFFADRSGEAARDHADFLEAAERLLPADLYAEVERTMAAGSGRRPADIVGEAPADA